MFQPTSRYYRIENAIWTAPDGRQIAYKRRRFVPSGREMPLLVEVTVVQGDRLDLIAARTLGDAEQFWRVCDANDAMNPTDLTGEPGRVLRVAVPQAQVS
ncbi:MAG: LysM peptidoglycan-binding domain-containing protein [Acidobacteriota bacterium]|nr:MAG: LysM peptidoglycan-binding domain-containing protein [Acidobacteriota bacterium]